jgi:hypothetical protein
LGTWHADSQGSKGSTRLSPLWIERWSAQRVAANTGVKGELIRIKGEVLLQQRPENGALAEYRFLAAIEFARTQGAIFWELRAALSAARLRIRQKNRAGAAQILEPVFDRFSEGFDTADMLAAKQLRGGPDA